MTELTERLLTLLFVDDEPGILAALRRLFRPHGYRILTAESGAEGLEVLGREEVDLVVSDMRMPNMDGAKFLREVRARRPQVVRLLLTGYADIASTIEAINHGEIYRYISKPWDDDEIVHTVKDALERKRLERENLRLVELTTRQNEELKQLNASLEQKVAARTAEVQQTLAFLEQAHKELKRGFMGTVRVFSGLIELRGRKLAGHSRRVAEHARSLAQRLGLDDAAVQDVLMAALLHDIGKIGLSDEILDRPFNSLSPDVRGEVMRHPVTGQMVILGIDQLKGAALLIRHHHECFDGSGFPDQLAGLAIPLGARILAVANDFDALQMGLLVNRPLKVADAWTFILENRGKRYDPQVVDAFAVLLAETQPAEMVIEVPMRPGTARPGMVLTRDLMHKDGYLLLAKGQVLDANIIEQLVRLEAMEKQHLTLHIRQEVK
ncbi:MAG: response regulator [Rhodocyclaceae bacterium]|nr:response regulator [Rhodocyclaceae bacterium]